jgi:hypothetical protein
MPLFLKSLWVRFYFFSLSFSKFMLQIFFYYYLFIWFQIMLLWILPEVEDQGARMSIKVFFLLFPMNLLFTIFLFVLGDYMCFVFVVSSNVNFIGTKNIFNPPFLYLMFVLWYLLIGQWTPR